MPKRKSLSKKVRFEVFKRDSFTCQYCGARAPDVVLQVDHIEPVASGGTDDFMNLITSCRECNAGKRDRQLSDTTVIEKRRSQLVELQERREQIEMMMEWQRELMELGDYQLEQLADFWAELVDPFSLNDNGRRSLKKLLGKYKLDEIARAMRIAVDQYVEYEDDSPIHQSVEFAWDKVGAICSIKRSQAQKPYLRDILYVRGILRNRLSYLDEPRALSLLEDAVEWGADIEWLKRHAKEVRNWSEWRNDIEDFILEHGGTI